MNEKCHKLLDRQLRSLAPVFPNLSKPDYDTLQCFLAEVAKAYNNFDEDRELLENSMELSSQELFSANKEMRIQNVQLLELKVFAEELRHERELILEAIGEGIYRVDTQGFLTFINLAALKMIGWSSNELIGKGPHEIFHHTKLDGTPYPKEECPIYAAFRDGKIHHAETEVFWRKDNSKFPVHFTSTPIYKDDKIVGAVVVFKDITKQKQLEKELQDAARQAGMAEIATGVLHNIGNILNSVNISAESIQRTTIQSAVTSFKKANALLEENSANLGEFFAKDPRGIQLLTYYLQLEKALDFDSKTLQMESFALLKNIQLIKDVVNLQQNYAKGVEFKEQVNVQETVESALTLQIDALLRHDIKVVTNFSNSKLILAQKSKLVHVLLNLIKNAKEAMATKKTEKILTIQIGMSDEENVYIKIADTGVGVSLENLDKIFTHGFTTKESGHGFGLHYSANAIAEMGGQISVHSAGENKGTVFYINFKSIA